MAVTVRARIRSSVSKAVGVALKGVSAVGGSAAGFSAAQPAKSRTHSSSGSLQRFAHFIGFI